MRRTARRVTGLVLAAALAIAAPAAALARTDGSGATTDTDRAVTGTRVADLDTVKERALEAIDRRLDRIDRLRGRVETSRFLQRDHEAHLVNELRASERGLTDLAGEIEEAGTLAELRELVPSIATDYRIYLVVTPKVWEVIASDAGVAAGERADEVAGRIQAAIERAAAAGHDVSEAQGHLDDMVAAAASGLALAEPVAGTVLPLEPADWPDPARATLEQGRADLGAAREWFRQARESAHDAIAALRASVGG